jgi:hypothetical protein
MDKRMINIDDLVRQRLGGVEEEGDRTGGWMQMRELLDKDMPVNTPGSSINWRRTFSYLAALLLITTASIGGYKIAVSNNNQGAGKDMATAKTAATNNGNNRSTADEGNNTPGKNNTSNALALAVINDKKKSTNNNTLNNADNAKNTTITTNNNTKDVALSAEVSGNHKLSANEQKSTNRKAGYIAANNKRAVHTSAKKAVAPAAAIAGNNGSSVNHKHSNAIAAASKTPATAGVQTANSKTHNTNSKLVAAAKHKKTAHTTNVVASTAALANANTKSNKKSLAGKIAKPHAVANYQINNMAVASSNTVSDKSAGVDKLASVNVPKDSIDVMNVQDRYHKAPGSLTGGYVRDTTSEEKMAAAAKQNRQSTARQPVPATTSASAVGAPALANTNNLVAANGTFAAQKKAAGSNSGNYTSANNTIVPGASSSMAASSATSTTIAKKKSKGMSMADRIDEALSNTKENVGHMQFTPGLLAGVNGTFFGANSFGGFHLGVSGEFTMNENWSVMAELRYLHRFTGGTAITDNYTTYNVPQPNTWERDSILHSFNFSTLHTIDLPISIRYKAGNFMVFAGGELVYNFAINYNESIGEMQGTLNNGSEPGNLVSKKPFIDNSDFAARFGAGYLFGVGYQITPQFEVDLRMMQTVWDNSKSASQQLISNDLYKSPSIQFTIGYKLNDKKPR